MSKGSKRRPEDSKKYKKMRSDFKKLKYDDYSVCNKCDIPYV